MELTNGQQHYPASNPNLNQALPPHPWRLCRHPDPDGDNYYYNPELRVVTSEDIRDPVTLGYLLDARNDCLHDLEDDPIFDSLPADYEMVLYAVTESLAAIRLYSRSDGKAYYCRDEGLEEKTKEHFWTYLCEYPSHHADLPPNVETEFQLALSDAKVAIENGSVFVYPEPQIDGFIARYTQLSVLRSEGQNTTAHLGWLIGTIMPLSAVGRRVDDERLAAVMNGLHF